MKKILVAVVLMAGVTAVAFASFSSNKKKTGIEMKADKKKNCSRQCLFNI